MGGAGWHPAYFRSPRRHAARRFAMNERENQALDALLRSKKYGAICEDTVRRAFEKALANHKSLKDADKAARAQLHQIAGAFMTADELRSAKKLLDQYQSGDAGALNRALSLHASTKERLSRIDALYDAAFEVVGKPDLVLDLACGLNPLYLGARGLSVRGYDIHGGAVELINRWAGACGWDVVAQTADVLTPVAYPKAALALMMKLLPVLRQQQSGAPEKLLRAVPARWKLVTFPTRTLGGRRVGMEEFYGEQFEALARETGHAIAARFVLADELCYVVKGEADESG